MNWIVRAVTEWKLHQGIGQATALAFAAAGASGLALIDLNEAGLEDTKQLILKTTGRDDINIQKYKVDVTSAESVSEAFASVKKEFGRLDYSVHCAGIAVFGGASDEVPVESFDRQNAIMYRGVWLCGREALRIMRNQPLDSEAYPSADIPPERAQRGAVVNISSTVALYTQEHTPAYAGAKAAVLGLTRADAVDYAKHHIRVNAILPGLIDSPMTKPTPEIRAYLEQMVRNKVPQRRLGKPEELADTITYLVSNKASFITGASFVIDGGFTAGYTAD